MQKAKEEQSFYLSPFRTEYVVPASMLLCAMDPWLTMEYTPEAFEVYLRQEDPSLSRFAVMMSQNVGGVLAVRYPWLFGPFIELMAIFDGYRGKGIGSQIIDWACERYNSENLWATVSSFNLNAQKFYSKAGFEQTTILVDLIKPGWDEILLRKRISAADKR